MAFATLSASGGSSPLARGTGPHQAAARAGIRFIPAGAGNSANWNLLSMSSTVHPRWRGEQALRDTKTCA